MTPAISEAMVEARTAGKRLRRSIDRWRGMSPEAVTAGSEAQILFCLRDAQHDLLVLAAALDRAQAKLEQS